MLIDCGGNLFVGDFAACDAGGFDQVVHVFRCRDIRDRASCQTVLTHEGSDPHNLVLAWREEDPLGVIASEIPRLIAFGRQPGRLLVHCRGGHCRSTNLAVLLARARQLDPFAVIDRINQERFRLTRCMPAWKHNDLNTILAWAIPRG